MLNPAPQEVEANLREKFSEPTSGVAAVLNEPIRTGAWQPESGDDGAATPPRSDYWDSLIDEPALLMRDRADGGKRSMVAKDSSVGDASADVSESDLQPQVATSPPRASEPEVEPEAAPVASDSGVVSEVVERAQQDAEIDHLLEELDVQPTSTVPTPSPAPPSAPTPPAPSAAPTPPTTPTLPTRSTEPQSSPEPVTTVTPSNEQEPIPAPEPAPRAPEAPKPEPTPPDSARVSTPTPTPAVPAAQTARVTAVPATAQVRPQPPAESMAPQPVVPSAKREHPRTEAVRVRAARVPADKTPEHELVAPVEMWFGDARVGVRPGSTTYDLFQKYARVLLDDLKRSRTSSLV